MTAAQTTADLVKALERVVALLKPAAEYIDEKGDAEFYYDGCTTDHIGFVIDCDNAFDRADAALAAAKTGGPK